MPRLMSAKKDVFFIDTDDVFSPSKEDDSIIKVGAYHEIYIDRMNSDERHKLILAFHDVLKSINKRMGEDY